MTNRKTIGIVVTILGLLMTCCLCPLTADRLVGFGTGGAGLYGRFFPRVYRTFPAIAHLPNLQVICISVLALVVLIVGIVVLIQARGNGTPTN